MLAYLILAAWFFVVDMIASRLAGVPPRPVPGAALALLWPISAAFAICASAHLIRHHRERAEALTAKETP